MIQCLLSDVAVIEVGIPMECGFEIRGGPKVMVLQCLGNPGIQAFDHTMGLRMAWRNQAMFEALLGTGLIKEIVAGGT